MTEVTVAHLLVCMLCPREIVLW